MKFIYHIINRPLSQFNAKDPMYVVGNSNENKKKERGKAKDRRFSEIS